MKKKWLCMGLALTMAVGLLAGCSKDKKEQSYVPSLPTASEEAEIYVDPIEGISDDFIRGMDISTVIALEEGGVKYYNEKGEEEDLFKILADSGVNYIRVRVWNDPYDKDGNGYGGGNCDVDKAATIGKRAAQYGMKLLVDFHYSDFWADPTKQQAPKAWEGLLSDDKKPLIYDYTKESLTKIIEAGADVGMVQIGNEINNGMAGEVGMANICKLLCSASEAVREVSKDKDMDIKIAVHYTQIDDKDMIYKKIEALESNGVDYDIFGVSYYTFWHGSMENMEEVLKTIKDTYGKDTCILETSYCYTGEDGDLFGNSIAAEDCLEDYPVSVQGQATIVRDIMNYANEAGSLGVFYWEGAWVPVGHDYDSNKANWEKYGTGWASSYSSAYDPDDAGKYYGGCSWDNQAFFDKDGKKLPSLDVFKYVKYGSTCDLQILAYRAVNLTFNVKDTLEMPDSVDVIYNNPNEKKGVAVTWDADQLAAIDMNVADTYTVDGVTEDGTKLTATVKVVSHNYLLNPSFEDGEMDPWVVTYPNGTECADIQQKPADCTTGEYAFHFYTDSAAVEFNMEQTVSASELNAGNYAATANIQGGDMGDAQEVYLYVKVGDQEYKSDMVTLDGWVNWKNLTIKGIEVDGNSDVTVGMYVKGATKAWGTIDDVCFFVQ